MTSTAPEPSPAPTLAGVPGYFPPTPDLASSSASAHPDPLAASNTEASTDESYAHRVNNAVGVAVGAAAGFLLGGAGGGILAGSIVGLGELENDGLKSELSPTQETAPSEKEAFATQEQNSNTALGESPAQKLVNSGENADEGSKITGAGALGGALLAGGAGAKVVENEVEIPNDDHSLTPTATRQDAELEQPVAAPDFGTPAIEKEQAELAHSPAQRLLGERSDSTVGAENILLAGGTGAVVADREVQEPALRSAGDEGEVASSSGAVSEGDESVSEPLERQVSSVPNPAPETPRPVVNTHESTSSFAAAVLAAGTGINTPTREDVPLSMSGSTGVHPLVQASDESMNDTASIQTATPDQPIESTPRTHPNILPAFVPVAVATPVGTRDNDVGPETTETAAVPASAEEVVHNPPPQVLATILPSTEAAEIDTKQPEDFEPYTPPAVAEAQEEPVEDDSHRKGVELAAAGAGAGVGGIVIAHELREKRSIDSTDGPSSHPGSVFQENFTPHPQPIEYDPLSIENQRAIPPQQAQGDPVLVMPTVDKGKGRAIDPEDLRDVPATSPEQAGFASGAPKTVATEEFAHLSTPAPQAELEAQKEVPPTAAAPVEAKPKSEKVVAAAVVPAIAGPAAAAAVPLAVNNNATSAQFSQTPMPVVAAPVQQQPIVAPVQQQPIATTRQAEPSRVYAAAPVVQQPQPQVVPTASIARTTNPHGLAEGVARSPHMHIQTHADDSGHKKLHRKSLAADRKPLTFGIGVTKASKPDKSIENASRRDRLMDGWSGVPDPTIQHQEQPVVVQQQQHQNVVHHQQPRPVQSPAAVVGHETAQPVRTGPNRLAAVTPQGDMTPPPVGSASTSTPGGGTTFAQVPVTRTSAPSSPTSQQNVQRKLSKSKPRRKSNASASGSEKGGFLNKVFGKHSRSSTSGSVDGGNNSNRGSLEMQRPVQ